MQVWSKACSSRTPGLRLGLRPALGLICRCPTETKTLRRSFLTDGRGQSDVVDPVGVIRSDFDNVSIETFRGWAFDPELPVVLKASQSLGSSPNGPLPALSKWFKPATDCTTRTVQKVLTEAMLSFQHVTLPYELDYPQGSYAVFIKSLKYGSGRNTPEWHPALARYLQSLLAEEVDKPAKEILRFHAPLGLLNAAIEFNTAKARKRTPCVLRGLYIAQAPLNHLPPALQADVPVPRIVHTAGKGDIYNSSIWLGLEGTYTPLHRDPNPNLFIQLCSSKVVRLLPPSYGDWVFYTIQKHFSATQDSSRIRGASMMEGPKASFTHNMIWRDNKAWRHENALPNQDPEAAAELNLQLDSARSMMQEAILEPGDALFIPNGWWHSVMSHHADGRLNGSVNWWFR